MAGVCLSITAFLFPQLWLKRWENEDIKLHKRSVRLTKDRISQVFRNASLGSAMGRRLVGELWFPVGLPDP